MSPAESGKLALVVRVSDVKGRDTKNGDRFISPELQVAGATGYATGKGYTVKRFDDMNVTHTTPLDKRPGMGAALKAIESGKLAGLIVSSQDRLGPLDITRELKKRLQAADAVLLVPDNPGIENVAARGYAKLPGENMALMHEAQREEIGLRWGKAKHSAWEREVYAGAAPVGFGKDADGKLVPDGNGKQAAVIEMFEARAEGKSFGVCAQILTDAGCMTSHGRAVWSASAVRAVSKNDIYIGVFRCTCGCGQEKEIEGLIERGLWLRAQREQPTKRKPRGNGEGQLLAGIVKCATCGYGMSHESMHGGKYRYWRCKANPACTAPATISADKVEPFIVTEFLERMGTISGERGGVDEERLAELQKDIAKADSDLATLDTMAEAGEVDSLEKAKAATEIRRKRDTLSVELDELRASAVERTGWYIPGPEDDDYEDGHGTPAVFEKLPMTLKRTSLAFFIERAKVAPGKEDAYERVAIEWRADAPPHGRGKRTPES